MFFGKFTYFFFIQRSQRFFQKSKILWILNPPFKILQQLEAFENRIKSFKLFQKFKKLCE